MKLQRRSCYCLDLQIKHLVDDIFLLYQQIYVKKLLHTFNIENANALAAPLMAMSKRDEDQYGSTKAEVEEVNNNESLATVEALLYFARNMGQDISFVVSIFVRHNERPLERH